MRMEREKEEKERKRKVDATVISDTRDQWRRQEDLLCAQSGRKKETRLAKQRGRKRKKQWTEVKQVANKREEERNE